MIEYCFHGVNSTALPGFSVQDTMTDDLYLLLISEIKLSITSLFSVQLISYLGASVIIYSDVNSSLISEILKYETSVIQSFTENPRLYYSHLSYRVAQYYALI